jgi:hypothetical protein
MLKAVAGAGDGWRVLLSDSSSHTTSGEMAAPSRQRQGRGACGTGTDDAIGKRLRTPTIGVDAAPEFMPKRDSELIGNRPGRSTGRRVSRVATSRFSGLGACATRIRARAGIRAGTSSAACVRHGQSPSPALFVADAAPFAYDR